MGFKVNLKVDTASLKRAIEAKRDLIRENIKTVLRTEAIPHLINRIMEGYDELSSRANQLPEDPSSPAHWRTEFLTKLEEDMERNLIITDRGFTIRLGDKDFLGYDSSGNNDPNDSTPLVWLVYYLEGLAGEWGFVSPELYEDLRGSGKFRPDWGRFGAGFLISRQQFEEEGWDTITSWDQIEHPFSGFTPKDIFTEALREFTFRPFVNKALKAAAEGRKL